MSTMGFRYLNGPVIIREYPEDATPGDFIAGDLVALSAGDAVVASAGEIWGVALKTRTDVAGTLIPVLLITSDMEFVCQADDTTTAAMVGEGYDIVFTEGSQAIDVGTQSAYELVIQQLDPRDGPHTGSGGRVIVKFSPTALQSHYGVT